MSNDPTPIVFNPVSGLKMATRVTAEEFRLEHPNYAWYYNPWTGVQLTDGERNLDPTGLGIRDPNCTVAPDDPTQHVRDMLRERPAFSAPDLLAAAEKHMRDRAATYDKPEGERSMGKTVQAFNAVTGRDLRESEGWLLLALLKMVRSETRETPHRDSVEDLIAYGGLYGEARLGGN